MAKSLNSSVVSVSFPNNFTWKQGEYHCTLGILDESCKEKTTSFEFGYKVVNVGSPGVNYLDPERLL